MTIVRWIVCAWVVLGLVARVDAAPRRFALLVGANQGDADDQPLRYAEGDAIRISEVLRDLGGFDPEDVHVLTDATAPGFRRAMHALNARIRRASSDSVLFVFYSGHADSESLHLAGTRLLTGELRELVQESEATVRILVVDACRSGGLTRRKGGRPGPAFRVDFDDKLRTKGMAILSSSADGEDSQESDRLRASFFTHYLASALRGAADDDRDGRVSLGEAFSYASQRTLAATTPTVAGPQHPMYRYDLTGREEVILTHPAALRRDSGALSFARDGTYLVQQRDASGAMVAEVIVAGSPRVVAVAVGDYFITRRATDHLLQGSFAVSGGTVTSVTEARMARTSYALVATKGAAGRTWRLGSFALLGGHGGLGARESLLQLDGGVRLDRGDYSVELAVRAGYGTATVPGSELTTYELGAMLRGFRVVQTGAWRLAGGVGIGPSWWVDQKAETLSPGTAGPAVVSPLGGVLGALGQVRYGTGKLGVRFDGGALAYWFREEQISEAGVSIRLTWQANLGLDLAF